MTDAELPPVLVAYGRALARAASTTTPEDPMTPHEDRGYPLADRIIDSMAARFGITFTPTERSLLGADGKRLHGLHRQRRYLLIQSLQGVPCPACQADICPRSAALHPSDDGSGYSRDDDDYACPACRRALHYSLDIHGTQFWELQTPVIGGDAR